MPVSKIADSFHQRAPRFILKSPPGTANDFVSDIRKNTIYGRQANPEGKPFANNSIGWTIGKIKTRFQSQYLPPEVIKKYGEERIARESMGLIHSKDEIYISYNINDQDLYQNPDGSHKEIKDNYCWYSSVPQVIGVNSSEDRRKCSKKFCHADVKCKIKNTVIDYKSTCTAIGASYDRCPKAVDCINGKNISVSIPSNWKPYVEKQKRNNSGKWVTITGDIDEFDMQIFPPGSWIPITGDFFGYYRSVPQLVSFPPATGSRSCSIQFCVADATDRGWNSRMKAVCKSTNGLCPIKADDCIKTKDVSVRNLSNPLEVEGVHLLAEIPQAQKTQLTYNNNNTDTSGSIRNNESGAGSPGTSGYYENEADTSGSAGSVK